MAWVNRSMLVMMTKSAKESSGSSCCKNRGATLKVACLAVVSAQVVMTLRLEADPEAGRPLILNGLDSLSTAKLRNWIHTKLGVEPTTINVNIGMRQM
ncbi:hypothetical protein F4809DRAFT_593033 [Biscogniauxia mediterranea]|nr:hypothetical protein F4809DRAFT_593033 [Biscogniauxia mediterranea]